MSIDFTIIYERDEGWWVATIPEVPGALSQGATKQEARENALDALHELMAARRELALQQVRRIQSSRRCRGRASVRAGAGFRAVRKCPMVHARSKAR